ALWSAAVHIVGKDILRFHAVYWPAFLMAAGLKLPAQIFAHGWWTNNGEKISKSLGNTVDPVELVSKYGIDGLRYFLFREVSFGQDGNFSHDALIGRMNSDLANSYGNLVQRVLSIAQKNLSGIVPEPHELKDQDEKLLQQADGLLATVRQDMDTLMFHRVCEHIWRVIAEANRYVDEEKPWVLKGTDVTRLQTVIYVLLETIRKVALLTQPLIPEGSSKILDQLAIPLDERDFTHWATPIQPGTTLPIPQGVFPRFHQE
ncbi:MAG: methionine--tRNA ligase, partial [Alphaproteobacteria bacterium]